MGETRSDREEADLIGRVLAGRKDLFDDLLKPNPGAFVASSGRQNGKQLGRRRCGPINASESDPAPEAVSEQGSFHHWLIQIAIHEVLQRNRLAVEAAGMNGDQ